MRGGVATEGWPLSLALSLSLFLCSSVRRLFPSMKKPERRRANGAVDISALMDFLSSNIASYHAISIAMNY